MVTLPPLIDDVWVLREGEKPKRQVKALCRPIWHVDYGQLSPLVIAAEVGQRTRLFSELLTLHFWVLGPCVRTMRKLRAARLQNEIAPEETLI